MIYFNNCLFDAFLLRAQNVCLKEKKDNILCLGHTLSTSLSLEILIIRNKTSNPEDFEFTMFNCILKNKVKLA